MFRKQDTKIHFVGIGGMGMCGLAERPTSPITLSEGSDYRG